jgi:ABC-2 type transport system permease protein
MRMTLLTLLPALHPDRCSSQEQFHPPPSYRGALRRELRRLWRRPRDFALATWLPLLAMLLFGGLVIALPPSELSLAVLDQDDSAASRQLLRRLDAGPELRVLHLPADAAPGDEVASGRAQATLVVPAGFGAALAATARSAVRGAAIAPAAGAARGPVAPSALPSLVTPQVDIRLAPRNDARDARVLAHVRAVLDSLAAEADRQAGAALAAGNAGPGAQAGGVGPAPRRPAASLTTSPLEPAAPRLHVDAPALLARADALVAGSAMLLMLLHLDAALLMASVVGREFSERSVAQWLAASGRRWRVALAAKLTLPAASAALQALLGLALWQLLAPAPLQGAVWLVALGLLLSQGAGLGLGLLLCGLLPSLRSALCLLGLLAPLVLVLLQHAAADSPGWAELLPVAHALRLVDHAWWQPASLSWDWPALRGLGLLLLQAAGLLGLGGWLLSRRAFLPGLAKRY